MWSFPYALHIIFIGHDYLAEELNEIYKVHEKLYYF